MFGWIRRRIENFKREYDIIDNRYEYQNGRFVQSAAVEWDIEYEKQQRRMGYYSGPKGVSALAEYDRRMKYSKPVATSEPTSKAGEPQKNVTYSHVVQHLNGDAYTIMKVGTDGSREYSGNFIEPGVTSCKVTGDLVFLTRADGKTISRKTNGMFNHMS